MFDIIKKLNPQIEIFKTSDKEFALYGKIIPNITPDEFINAAKAVKMPDIGSVYTPSLVEFENTSSAQKTADICFGEMDVQIGYCYGHSNRLNAVEWHKSSEINVAVTPLVLILGQVQDIVDGKIDSSKLKAFYVEKGEVIEVYSTSLHFCPCQVQKTGFGCVVVLPRGTNTPLEKQYDDKLLFRKNKWILAHVDNNELISKGVTAGVTGENYTIIYE